MGLFNRWTVKDRPLKIAMIGHKRIPSREGGVEIVVMELSMRLVMRGNDVDAFNRWNLMMEEGKVDNNKHRFNGVRLIQIPTPANSKLNAFVYSIIATLRAIVGGYDVIHYHAIGSCAMIWLAKLFGCKTIATVHGLDWQRAKWNKFAVQYLKFGEKMAAKFADEIIVLSKANQKYFLDTYHRKTNLIPNGMQWHDVPAPSVIRDKYGLERGDYILYLARIVPEKGLHYLLDAFLQIDTNKRLIVAGKLTFEDEYCRKIQQLASRDSRVILTDFVQGRELEELFGNCLVYVLPSDIEGMPISLLEAISYHARCLVSDIDENVETSKGCAEVFERGNVDSLRDKLSAMINASTQSVTSTNNIWESWDQVTDETLSLYEKTIKEEKVNERG